LSFIALMAIGVEHQAASSNPDCHSERSEESNGTRLKLAA
jgi:hypothetical protein